jgi:hypothetical protein
MTAVTFASDFALANRQRDPHAQTALRMVIDIAASTAIVCEPRDDRQPQATVSFASARGIEPHKRLHCSGDPVIGNPLPVIAHTHHPVPVIACRRNIDRGRAVFECVVDEVRHEPVEQGARQRELRAGAQVEIEQRGFGGIGVDLRGLHGPRGL